MRAASAWRCALCVALSLLAPAAPAPPPVPLKGLPATSWGQQSPGSAPRAQAASPAAHDGQAVGYAESARLRAEAADAFAHAYGGYLNTAYPRDETKPLSCGGIDSLGGAGGYMLTLVDALDGLAMMGNASAFADAADRVVRKLQPRLDRDVTVSVFETTIRLLGGLLSAHAAASDVADIAAADGRAQGQQKQAYSGELLELASDLASRLLRAFETPTGVPYGAVNLRSGVAPDESTVTATAAAGTLSLEFGALARLSNRSAYERVARRARDAVWARRSQLGLVGAHIDVKTGEWTQQDAGVGTSIDSFYEYLLKQHVLFGDAEALRVYHEAVRAADAYISAGPWLVEVNMHAGTMAWQFLNALAAFWPGLRALGGEPEKGTGTYNKFVAVWRTFGFTPEGFDIHARKPAKGQTSYPLRPELIESTYHLFRSTGNRRLLEVGRDMLASLRRARAPCGYARVVDVRTHQLDDHMESFFLAETAKYLYFLFDAGASPTREGRLAAVNQRPHVLTTEGHALPMTTDVGRVLTARRSPELFHLAREGRLLEEFAERAEGKAEDWDSKVSVNASASANATGRCAPTSLRQRLGLAQRVAPRALVHRSARVFALRDVPAEALDSLLAMAATDGSGHNILVTKGDGVPEGARPLRDTFAAVDLDRFRELAIN